MPNFLKITNIQYQAIFLLLFLIYFILGIYLIQTTSIASDEPAYIGAAYSYTQGLGLNPEHPPLLKMINAALIKLFYPEHNISLPDPSTLVEDSAIRLAGFNVGYTYLISNPEGFDKIIFISRIGYLAFNSILLLWLYVYTYVLKLITPVISITLAILCVFSPSFYSHNFLISFDVSVAICALLTILSLTILIINLFKFSSKQLLCHFLITTILLFFSLNAKFSNLILLPIVIGAYFLTIIYLIKTRKSKVALKFTVFSVISLVSQPLLIAFIYRIAFRKLPNQSIVDNLNRYLQGVNMTLGTKDGVQQPFLYGKFVPITYMEYIQKIFWFKENPCLFLIILVIILSLIGMIINNRQ
ncbi:MAG: hypothetical protein F6K10_40370, partial [Moorea sp. SIO2B7]|nr:hypothetical protein [Moorena sp. SIO2B7]